MVAPRSLVFNWRQEAARFAPGLRVLEYTGTGRDAARSQFGDYDLVLTTYGTLRRDAALLAAIAFDYVVLDEAQAIKNAASVSAKAARLLDARHRLALSGTPIENHLGELWSLFEFLNPGLLGRRAAFERRRRRPRLDDETIAHAGARRCAHSSCGAPRSRSRRSCPPKTEQTLYCELERPQRALYDELRAHYRAALLGGAARERARRVQAAGARGAAATAAGGVPPGPDRYAPHATSRRPSSTCCVPRLHRSGRGRAQDAGLLAVHEPAGAFCATRLDEAGVTYEYLDGRTRDREARVERFQNDPTARCSSSASRRAASG